MARYSKEAAKAEFLRLLKHWREIEFWLKRAEQINGKAIIPAINELRYASRQLFNAVQLFDKVSDSTDPSNLSIITKRLIIAEQYLLNADNDIADSVVTFYRAVVSDLDNRYGQHIISSYFHYYPIFKSKLSECEQLIADSRGDYALRGPNYRKLRIEYFPELVRMHERLVEAEVGAKAEKQRKDREVAIAKGRADIGFYFGIFGALIGALGFLFSIYTWRVSGEEYCKLHKDTPVMNIPCKLR